MEKIIRAVQILFGIPWLVFGVQHFMYADFVASLVPAYFPARLFLAYFTGAAMFAAGVSFIVNIKARLAAVLIGTMLLLFLFLIHGPKIIGGALLIDWTRALQDVAIASSAFMLAGNLSNSKTGDGIFTLSRYVFAAMLVVFGAQHFLDMDFLTAKVAPYLPLRMVWVYLTGAAMFAAAASVFFARIRLTAVALGTLMLILNLLLHIYLLAGSPYNPRYWTVAMLDLAVTCGAFFLAGSSAALSQYENAVDNISRPTKTIESME